MYFPQSPGLLLSRIPPPWVFGVMRWVKANRCRVLARSWLWATSIPVEILCHSGLGHGYVSSLEKGSPSWNTYCNPSGLSVFQLLLYSSRILQFLCLGVSDGLMILWLPPPDPAGTRCYYGIWAFADSNDLVAQLVIPPFLVEYHSSASSSIDKGESLLISCLLKCSSSMLWVAFGSVWLATRGLFQVRMLSYYLH